MSSTKNWSQWSATTSHLFFLFQQNSRSTTCSTSLLNNNPNCNTKMLGGPDETQARARTLLVSAFRTITSCAKCEGSSECIPKAKSWATVTSSLQIVCFLCKLLTPTNLLSTLSWKTVITKRKVKIGRRRCGYSPVLVDAQTLPPWSSSPLYLICQNHP